MNVKVRKKELWALMLHITQTPPPIAIKGVDQMLQLQAFVDEIGGADIFRALTSGQGVKLEEIDVPDEWDAQLSDASVDMLLTTMPQNMTPVRALALAPLYRRARDVVRAGL